MTEVAAAVLDVAVVAFAVSSMLSVGLGSTLAEIAGPLRHVRGVIRALVANFVLVPALALLVVRVMPLDEPLEIGSVRSPCRSW